jgi:hypothetical protein
MENEINLADMAAFETAMRDNTPYNHEFYTKNKACLLNFVSYYESCKSSEQPVELTRYDTLHNAWQCLKRCEGESMDEDKPYVDRAFEILDKLVRQPVDWFSEKLAQIMNETDLGNIHALAMQMYDSLPMREGGE